MGSATPYANKIWVACSNNKKVLNNHETHTHYMYLKMNRCGHLYTKYRTVNTVYIEYKSVVTHSHGLTHISGSAYFSTR